MSKETTKKNSKMEQLGDQELESITAAAGSNDDCNALGPVLIIQESKKASTRASEGGGAMVFDTFRPAGK